MAREIIYNGAVISNLEDGQRATLTCAGKKMLTNLLITDSTVQWTKLASSEGVVITDANGLKITTMEE